MQGFSERIDQLGAHYGLQYDERDWRQLLIGQLERAYQVLEDATPERLVGHGGVSPDLKAALGPDIAELQLALRTMQALVHQLRRESG